MFPTQEELKSYSKNSDSNSIIKLKKDGDSISGLFAGNSVQFHQHWVDGQKLPVPCKRDISKQCALCDQGHKSTFRFRINMLVSINKKLTPMIFENGWTVLQSLMAIDKHAPLSRHQVTVVKSIANGKHSYTIIPKTELKEEQLVKIRQIPLLSLAVSYGDAPVPPQPKIEQNQAPNQSSQTPPWLNKDSEENDFEALLDGNEEVAPVEGNKDDDIDFP